MQYWEKRGNLQMNSEVSVAIIGAMATVLASIVGAYASLKRDTTPGVAATPRVGSRSRVRAIGIVIVGAILAATVLVLGYQFGAAASSRNLELERRAQVGNLVKSYSSIIADGVEKQRRYAIPTIVMLITLEKTADGKFITSDRHIFYQLQALTDISKDPAKNEDAFREEYHSHYDVDHVPGSDPERIVEDRPGMQRWNVLFGMEKGGRHAVVTGAHVVMPIRLKSPRAPEHMFEGLGPTEDAFCYPNDDGDVIEELVIVVQSGSLDLYLPSEGNDDAVLQHDVKKQSVESDMFVSKASSHKHVSLVARFSNVQKNDVVGLRVGWKLP